MVSEPILIATEELLDAPAIWLGKLAERQVTDVYFTARQSNVEIKVRQFGRQQPLGLLKLDEGRKVILRLKSATKMNIADSRMPQDGRFQFGEQDARVATHPSLYGECIAIRLLGNKRRLKIDELGLPTNVRLKAVELAAKPEGLILVSGPTGSGKTTLLHAIIDHLGESAGRMATLEDPVEILNPAATQTDLSACPGLTFAMGLRSLMRQDPDTLLIGEIRDQETANLCLNAALTGHRVFASVHAPDALGTLFRLQELGTPLPSLLNCMNGVINLRLDFAASGKARLRAQLLQFPVIPRNQLLGALSLAHLESLCQSHGAYIQ